MSPSSPTLSGSTRPRAKSADQNDTRSESRVEAPGQIGAHTIEHSRKKARVLADDNGRSGSSTGRKGRLAKRDVSESAPKLRKQRFQASANVESSTVTTSRFDSREVDVEAVRRKLAASPIISDSDESFHEKSREAQATENLPTGTRPGRVPPDCDSSSDDIVSSDSSSSEESGRIVKPQDSKKARTSRDRTSADASSSTADRSSKNRVTPLQVAKFAGVVLSAPVRAGFGLLQLPAIAVSQAVTSTIRAVRSDKSADSIQWNQNPSTPAEKFDSYKSCMILEGEDDWRGAIGRGVRLTRHTQGVPRDGVAQLDPKVTFKELGRADRLDILAHGNGKIIGGYDPHMLMLALQHKGLNEIGVLNLGACSAASGTFLEDLGNELNAAGIRFGWIAGTRGLSSDFRMVSRLGKFKYTWGVFAFPWKRTSGYLMPRSLNRKVLKGNINVNFKGTVFDERKPNRLASKYSPLR